MGLIFLEKRINYCLLIASLLKNGLVAAHGRAADFAGFKKTGKIERLAETCFGQPVVEKARTAFSTG